MTERKPPELFAEPPVRSEYIRMPVKRLPFRLRYLLFALVLILFVVAGYWYYDSTTEEVPAEIPVIKSEGPIKQRPDHPGGIDIPHQNETVFQQIDSGMAKPAGTVEHLLPPPPVPQDGTGTTAQAVTQAVAPAPVAAPVSPVAAVEPKPVEGKVEKLAAPAESTAAQMTPSAPPAAPASAVPDGKPEPSVAKAATKPAETGSIPKEMFTGETSAKDFYIQLGSFPDKKKADSEMVRIRKKFASALTGVNLEVSRANIKGKGVFYRIQGGPYSDAGARSVCATLRSKKAPCIVVRP